MSTMPYTQRIVCCVAVLVPSASTMADIVFEQPTKLPHHVCDDCWTSDRGQDGEWRSFDDFMFANRTVITEVVWQGAYWDTRDDHSFDNPVDPDTDEWEIGFFPNRTIRDRSFPDTRSRSVVYRENISADAVETTFLEEYEFDWPEREGESIPVYEFKVTLAEPITLDADTQYWLSPLSFSNRLQPLFVWTVSDRVGKSRQIGSRGQSGRYIRDNNFVFTLLGVDGDFNQDNEVDSEDIDVLASQIMENKQDAQFDLTLDGKVDASDLRSWVVDFKGTWFGDANLDGEFNTGDLVTVFQAGQYEDGIPMNSSWGDGDFNGDGEFNTSDLVVAFADGGFESGNRANVLAVPEPNSVALPLAGGLLVGIHSTRSRRKPKRGILRRQQKRSFQIAAAFIASMMTCMVTSQSHAELISHGNFDSLPVGSAPNNDHPLGSWQFYHEIETINSNGTYTDDYVLHEEYEGKISIVDTSSLDPSRDGNSLKLVGDPGITILNHMFEEPFSASPDQYLQANFEVFVTKPERDYSGTVFFSADHGGGGTLNSWDRGPQISVRNEGVVVADECDSIHCTVFSETRLSEDSIDAGEWQRIQLNIDVATNTYDAYWAQGNSEFELVGDDLRFRAQDIEVLDRINLAFFREELTDGTEVGEFYLDNVSVTVREKSPQNVLTVPEPSNSIVSAVIVLMLACSSMRVARLGTNR